MKKMRVLVLFYTDVDPPASQEYKKELESSEEAEFDVARALRVASPTASPNTLFVALADRALGRRGRMSEAIAEIGRGRECFEGEPFALELN